MCLSCNHKNIGAITKALVLKCDDGIKFSGCKQRDYKNPDAEFLKFPYIVGLTFSSQDMVMCFQQ